MTALSLAGLAARRAIGARAAPHVLHGGSYSPYTPLDRARRRDRRRAAPAGRRFAARLVRAQSLKVVPPLRLLDSIGGLVAGALLGLALVWVAGAAALQLPNRIPELPNLHQQAQQSAILKRAEHGRAAARLPARARAHRPVPASHRAAAADAAVPTHVLAPSARRARAQECRARPATACGLGVEGSGWFAKPHLVVTAAHVVAGGHGIDRERPRRLRPRRRPSTTTLPCSASRRCRARRYRSPNPKDGDAVAILGYPENGPFDVRPGRIGTTADVLVSGNLARGDLAHSASFVRELGRPRGRCERARSSRRSSLRRIGSRAGFGVPAVRSGGLSRRRARRRPTGSC